MNDSTTLVQQQNYRIYLISNIIISLVGGVFGPFYILFVQQKGGGVENFGLALGFLLLTQSIVSYFAGKYSDISGRKPLLILQGYLFSIVILSYLFIVQIWQLYLLQIINGLLGGIEVAVGSSFLADITETKNRGRMIGKYQAIVGITTAIAMMLSGYFVALTGIKTIFIIMAIANVFSATLYIFIKEKRN